MKLRFILNILSYILPVFRNNVIIGTPYLELLIEYMCINNKQIVNKLSFTRQFFFQSLKTEKFLNEKQNINLLKCYELKVEFC